MASGHPLDRPMADADLASTGAGGSTVADPVGPGAPAVVPVATPDAHTVFGDRLPLAVRYAGLLVDDAVRRGLIGPREADRIWDRHLVNCGVVAAAFPPGARVVDVGSGAGLPGLVLACVRADLRIDLVDSLNRRTRFLDEAVAELDLSDRVRVITGRAEDKSVRAVIGDAHWVTARAVAPLERLAGWCLPLLAPDGALIALKGAGAQSELDQAAPALRRLRAGPASVTEFGRGTVAEPTVVIVVRRH